MNREPLFWVIAYLVVVMCTWVIIAGWLYADVQRGYPSIAKGAERQDAGFALTWGMIYGTLWPLGLLFAFLLTGLAEYGWVLPGRKTN